MSNIVYIACSLDGYIADQNNSIEWLTNIPNPTVSDYGFNEFIQRIDGILMGRMTFETVLAFGTWPYTKPVFVLSKTLKEVPDFLNGKVKIVSGNIKDIRDELEKDNIKNLYVDGGKTIQSLLKEDMIDEMIIATISVVLGGGYTLFGTLENRLDFKLTKTEKLSDFVVKNYYERIRK